MYQYRLFLIVIELMMNSFLITRHKTISLDTYIYRLNYMVEAQFDKKYFP